LTTTALKINNDADALAYIQQSFDGLYDNSVVELCFDNWPIFHINVKGDRYNSTLPTSLMRSLIDLQSHLNRVYAEIIYGRDARTLTQEERNSLEIIFRVNQGSSDIFADLSGVFSAIAGTAMSQMTGKQLVTTVLGVAALWGGASSYDSYLTKTNDKTAEKNRHEITLELIKQQPKLLQIQNDHIATNTNILRSVSDAEQVTLDTTVINNDELGMITRSERKETELRRLDDLFLISSLKKKQDSYKIEIIRKSDNLNILTELFKNHLSIDEMNQIMNAFTSDTPIPLNIVGRVRGEIIISANIVGINNSANGSVLPE